MAASGAKVLQLRSVEYARNHGVRIHCRSSFDDGPGTFVLGEDETMERPLVTAVTHSTDEARITLARRARPARRGRRDLRRARRRQLQRRHDHPERAARGRAAAPRSRSRSPSEDLAPPRSRSSRSPATSGSAGSTPTSRSARSRSSAPACARIPGVAAKVFQTLAEEGINIEMISTSPIKISCVIRSESVPQAVRALHGAFDLGAGGVRARRRTAMSAGLRVAVVGATGAVGTTMLELLREREFPAREIVPFASERSARPRGRRRCPSACSTTATIERLRHRAVLRRRRPLAPVGADGSSRRARP